MNRRALWVGAGVALCAAPAALSDFWVFIAIEMLAFALYAVSFNVLLGYGGMLSFGHAAFFGVGAYAAALLTAKSGLPPGVAFACFPVVAMGAAAAVAAVVGYFSVRRSGIYFGMLTFAFQMLLYTVALKASGITGGDDGIAGLKPPGPLAKSSAYYYFALFIVSVALALLHRLVSSPFGMVLRALKANPRRTTYVGVDVRRHQLAAFVISGAFAGLAGALFAISSGNVFPNWLNWTASATPIVMAVMGGVSTFLGPALGAAVYVVLEVLISGHTVYWPMVMGFVILALVLLMPQGLTGLVRGRPR